MSDAALHPLPISSVKMRCAKPSATGSRPPGPRSIGRCGCCRGIAATACTRSMRSAVRSTTLPMARGRSNTSSRLWPGGARRSRRSMTGVRAISWLVPCRGRCGVISFAEKIFLRSSPAWRWTLAGTSEPPIWPPSTSIAPESRARSAISRFIYSAIPAMPPMRVAESLGRALQLTNILRDLAEDAARQRLYLPREILDRHGIRADEPAAVLRHPALPAACRDVAAIAETHFREAARAMEQCSHRAMRPAAVMAALYRATLSALQRSGWRNPMARVSVATSLKLWLVLRHGLL